MLRRLEKDEEYRKKVGEIIWGNRVKRSEITEIH